MTQVLTQTNEVVTVAPASRILTRPVAVSADMNIFELEEALVKTIIGDTIETYSGQWRLIHEAVQNAHDAIQQNANITDGSVEIHFFVASNIVTVRDNGKGIAANKYSNVFVIGGSDKTSVDLKKILKGSQGVGIKSTLYTSRTFKVDTIHDGQAWSYEIKDCYRYKEPGFKLDIVPPKTTRTGAASGSVFSYSLADYAVQDFINEVVREYCDETKFDREPHVVGTTDELRIVLETYFRTRTYLGCAQAMMGLNPALKPINVKVVLEFDSDNPEDYKGIDLERCKFFENEDLYKKRISQTFPAKYIDIFEIHEKIPRGEKADKIFDDFKTVLNNPPDQTTKKLLIQKFDQESVKGLLSKTKRNNQTGAIEFAPDLERLRKHKAALDAINGMYLVVAQKTYLLKYFHVGTRQTISVNGLPTNISLSLPVGALAYLNNIHLVLDVNCTLGFGKRNLPGRTKGSLDAFYIEAWNMLRRVVPLVVGQREGVDPADLIKWDKTEEFEHYKEPSNKLRGSSLFFKTTPREEQEVIALFFELLGRGKLKGYFPFRLGGKTIYDGLFYIDMKQGNTVPQNLKASELRLVEFKPKLSKLFQDLEDEIKFLNEIDLLVCWENDIADDVVTDYSIHSLARDNISPYPGAQLRVQRKTDYCQVLVLKDFLESEKLI